METETSKQQESKFEELMEIATYLELIIDVNGRAFIAVEVRKTQDKFVYLRNAATGAVESVEQVQVFDALTATFADETLVGKAITKMASRIKMQADDAGRRARNNVRQAEYEQAVRDANFAFSKRNF